jgi:putative transposase
MNCEWITAAQAAGLPDMPRTQQRAKAKLDREGARSRKRSGRGGGLEYHISSLPEAARNHLIQQQVNALETTRQARPPAAKQSRAVTPNAELADWQRQVRDARLAVLSLIDELRRTLNGKAVDHLIGMAASGTLPDGFADTITIANARHGSRQTALTRGTVYRWLKDREAHGPDALAPAAPPAKANPEWLGPLLARYQRPSKPSIAQALDELREQAPQDLALPPLRTAQRHVERLPVEIREYRRMGPRAMRSVQPFVRRTCDGLWPMDIVTVDGHCAKCYVRHPHSGRRIRPEVTTYIDIATRKALAFSVWWAESQYAIWLAMRTMVLDPEHGIAAIQYSDRGAYRGQEHRALLSRLGTEPMFSMRYRAQARGAIERINSSIWVPLARTQPTYCGKDADQEAFKCALKRFDDTGRGILEWDDWIAACRKKIDDYNAKQHTSLKRGRQTLSPNQAWEIARDEGWEPTTLDDDDLHDLLPSAARHVSRAEVRLPWGLYANGELRHWHRRLVRVHYDPADGSRVWVAGPNGNLICVAGRDANARPYVSESQIEHARTKREEGRIARLERKIAVVKEEETPLIEIAEGEVYDLPILSRQTGDGLDLEPALAARVEAERANVERLSVEHSYLDALDSDPARYDALRILRERNAAGDILSEREYQFMESFGHSTYARMADEMREKFEADCSKQHAP